MSSEVGQKFDEKIIFTAKILFWLETPLAGGKSLEHVAEEIPGK